MMTSKKIVTASSYFTVISCICLTCGFGAVINESGNTPCLTKTCVDIASDVLKYMDQKVDPCDNFYKFTCGKFLESVIIPEDKKEINYFEILEDLASEQIYSIINEPIKSSDFNFVKNIKYFFQSCRKMTNINGTYTLLLGYLKNLGGWPVLEGDQWNETQFDLMDTVYKIGNTIMFPNYLFKYTYVKQDNITVKLLSRMNLFEDNFFRGNDFFGFGRPFFKLQEKIILESSGNETASPYWKKMIDIAETLGAEREQAEKDLLESFKFEIQLVNISLLADKLKKNDYIKLSNLTELYPTIPWKNFLERFHSRKIDNNVTILVETSYIENFEKLMKTTPKRIQANYLIWRVVSSLWETYEDFIEYYKFNDTLKNKKKCLDITHETFNAYISKVYLEKYFDDNVKEEAIKFINSIKNELSETLKQMNFSDEKSREISERKLNAISFKVFGTDEMLNNEDLEEYYKDLVFDENNFFFNYLRFKKFDFNSKFIIRRLEPVNFSQWENFELMKLTTYYLPWNSTIHISAGVLQRPFFEIKAPKYMNYGGMALLIGSKIIDIYTAYSQYQSIYNFSIPCTTGNDYENVQCLTKYYTIANIFDYEISTDSFLTLDSKQADLNGVLHTYWAYTNWLEKNGPEMQLPKLPYTNKQMFWISVAHSSCEKIIPEEFQWRMTQPHIKTMESRILQALMYSAEFLQDFNCSIDSNMHPKICPIDYNN